MRIGQRRGVYVQCYRIEPRMTANQKAVWDSECPLIADLR